MEKVGELAAGKLFLLAVHIVLGKIVEPVVFLLPIILEPVYPMMLLPELVPLSVIHIVI